ncbi:MAG: hypothetical protein RIT81_13610 [Deltaproteobacteria bacterium]
MPDAADEERILQLMAFGQFEDCVDETEIDHADLIAWARGGIAADRRSAVEAHVDRCAYCEQMLDAYRTPAAEPTRWVPNGGLLLAIAAAIVLFVSAVVESPTTRGTYVVDDVRGLAAPAMGEPPPSSVWRVGETSSVEFVYRSAPHVVVPPQVAVGVFAQTPQGTYRLVTSTVERIDDGDGAAFRVAVPGRDLILALGTRRSVALVVGADAEALRSLEGILAFAGRDGVIDFELRRIEVVR